MRIHAGAFASIVALVFVSFSVADDVSTPVVLQRSQPSVVASVAVSPAGGIVASACKDGLVRHPTLILG